VFPPGVLKLSKGDYCNAMMVAIVSVGCNKKPPLKCSFERSGAEINELIYKSDRKRKRHTKAKIKKKRCLLKLISIGMTQKKRLKIM
jgi:hypothetical protein